MSDLKKIEQKISDRVLQLKQAKKRLAEASEAVGKLFKYIEQRDMLEEELHKLRDQIDASKKD